MSGLVVYSSKYGSTREYAEWIGGELSFPAVPCADAKRTQLEASDLVILGSSVNMGSLTIKSWIRKNWPVLAAKRLILFTVSGTPPSDEKKLRETLAASLAPEMIGRMQWFPLHGRIRFAALPPLLRFMLKAFSGKQDAAGGAAAGGGPDALQEFDDVRRENIAPIVKAARAI